MISIRGNRIESHQRGERDRLISHAVVDGDTCLYTSHTYVQIAIYVCIYLSIYVSAYSSMYIVI